MNFIILRAGKMLSIFLSLRALNGAAGEARIRVERLLGDYVFFRMKNNWFFTVAFLAGGLAVASGQNSIVYLDGPSFAFPPFESGGAVLDLNGDGVADFSFASGVAVCTADVPPSACTLPYYAAAEGSNGILRWLSQATILAFGEEIGDAPTANSTWSDSRDGVVVADLIISQRFRTSIWGGPLNRTGVGYLGTRFYAADGLHYGWIRVRKISQLLGAPLVVDWAYESRPGTSIRAGVIGSGGGSSQFAAQLRNRDGTPQGSAGTFILTGDRLRCEVPVTASQWFSSASIAGPAPIRSRAKAVADLGQPLALLQFGNGDHYTAFFGDVTLSRGEVNQLLRGADAATIDGGSVFGQITPLR